MKKPTLSVIVPTYNRADRLKISLENYLQSDRLDIEFIVIDNNSTDNTEELVHSFLQTDKRLHYVKNPANLGPNRSLFRGFLNARGNLIMILPDDDSITKGFINLVIDTFEKYPTAGVVHSVIHYSESSPKHPKGDPSKGRLYHKGVDALSLIYMQSGSIAGLTFKRNVIDYSIWKLDDSIYPQIRISCDIALRQDVYFICSQTEYVTVGELDDVLTKAKTRPLDYGVLERVNIALDVVKRLSPKNRSSIYQSLTAGLLIWSSGLFLELYKIDRIHAFKYLNVLLDHPHIKSSSVFWGALVKMAFPASRVRLSDKLVISLIMIRVIILSILNPNFYQSISFILRRLTHYGFTRLNLNYPKVF